MDSPLQNRFMSTIVVKRSKKYFDLAKLNQIQRQQQLIRRKPQYQNSLIIDKKVKRNFVSTSDTLSRHVNLNLSKTHSHFQKRQTQQTQISNSNISPSKKINAFSMQKMLPRQYFFRNCQNPNQEIFCNFELHPISKNRIQEFNKTASHTLATRVNWQSRDCKTHRKSEEIVEIQNLTQIGKIKQKLLYDGSIFRPLIDYKKGQNKKKLQKNDNPEIDYERLQKADKFTRKRPDHRQLQFYYGDVKWNYSQMEERFVKQESIYLKKYNQKERKIECDLDLQKKQLIAKKKQAIKDKKKIKDVKEEMCDSLYFRRNRLVNKYNYL